MECEASYCHEKATTVTKVLGMLRHVCPRHANGSTYDTEGIVQLLRRLETSENPDERDCYLADYRLVQTTAPVRLARAMDVVMRTPPIERSVGDLPAKPF